VVKPALTRAHLALFSGLWFVTLAAVAIFTYPEVFSGAQLDADGYMRLVRVGLLVETAAWFDHVIPRSNWPVGEALHWTRPLDVLIVALAAPLIPFIGTGPALNAAGSLVSPLLHLASCLLIFRVAAPLVSHRALALAAPALLVQPVVISYGLPGRADHHALIGLLFIAALGTGVRWMLEPTSRRWPALTGAICALGIWVSPEFMLPLALFFAAGGLLWLSGPGGRHAVPPNLALSGALFTGLVVALLLERPPSAWLAEVHDRISIVHVAMAAVALGFWGVVAGVVRAREGGGGALPDTTHSRDPDPDPTRFGEVPLRRIFGTALGAVGAAGVMALLYPDFFRGPWISAHPEVQAIWLSRVQELQPLLTHGLAGFGHPGGLEGLGRAVATVGMAPVAVVFLARLPALARRATVLRPVLVLATVLFALMTLAQLRWGLYAGVMLALGITVAIDDLLGRIDERASGLRRRLLRVGTILLLIPAPLLVGFGVESVDGDVDARAAASDADARGSGPETDRGTAAAVEVGTTTETGCPIARVAPQLRATDGLGARPTTVLAHLDRGPEILFRTPHRILAGPYHRNADGILDIYAVFTSPDPEVVRGIVSRRDAGLILICPEADRGFLGDGPPESLFHRLVDGPLPDWVEEIDLNEPPNAGIRLFRIRAVGDSPAVPPDPAESGNPGQEAAD